MSDEEDKKTTYYNEKVKRSIYKNRSANRERYNEIARESYRRRMQDPVARAHWNAVCRVNSKKWRDKKKLEKEQQEKDEEEEEEEEEQIDTTEKEVNKKLKHTGNPFDPYGELKN